ncbi:MAG: SusC/RagA family TonB-linked outer membrane protein [Prevotellaceae bacterium]|nr:SusC/RagA family TonB-linked outer membrane protein [Candidatus Minthosoma caballi]
MEKTYKYQKSLLRACIGLMMLSGVSTALAQEAEETAPAKKVKTETAPAYEMKDVRGVILDAATKTPIDGARVQAFGNKRYSVMTDENGNYTIKVPVFVNSLYVTVPGYNDIRVAFDGNTAPTVSLYSSKFNSVYSEETSITSSAKANINNTSAIVADEEIDAQLSGDIHTINRNGVRGQGVAMFIRGLNSLNINAQPLVVLDGMIMDLQLDRTSIHDGFFNNILAGIDTEDIESIEVLKNATSVYGSRGSNGVVIINTRRGHSLATKINASISTGFEFAPSTPSMMNGSQYRNYVSDLIGTTEYGMKHSTSANSISFLNNNPDYYWYPLYHNNTDWSDGMYRTAVTQNYKVNVQGGDDVAMYNLSLGYANSQSTLKDNGFDRLNVRFNTDIKLVKNISTQLDLAYSRFTNNLRDNGWAESYASSTISSPNVLGLIQAPFLSKYGHYTGEDGKLHLSKVYAGKYVDDANYPFDFASSYGTNAALANPYWILENGEGDNKNRQEVTQFQLNIMPKWEINKHLTLSNRFAYQLNRSNEKYYLPEAGIPVYNYEGYGDVTSVVRSLFSKETSIFEDFRIDWKQNYKGIHDVHLYGGFRFTTNSFSDSYMSGYNSGNDKMPDMKNSLSFRSVDGNQDTWKNIAYYANADWSIKNTYFLQATLTAETSSRFGKEASEGIKLAGVKWGLFPSIQAGWVITNEKWFAKSRGINFLKLSAGYDESGNDNFDYSLARTYFKSTAFLKQAIALKLANIENPSIQWETTRSWNVALNGSFLNNRLQAGVDFYIKNTSNLITYHTINYMSGLAGNWSNDGRLRNMGADVKVNGILVNTKDFKWQLGATLGHYKNEITSLPNDYISKIYGAEILTAKGNAAGVFYGYKAKGVFASDAEASKAHNGSDYLKYPTGVTSKPYKNFQAGDVHFADLDGNGVINESDKTIIGDPNPDIFGTIYTNFSYKNWSLDINFKYSLGNDIYNYQRSQLENANGFFNQTTAVVNRWTSEGQVTDMPRAMASTSELWVNNERFSDRWIEDGSFLKLKKIRLSYELPLSLSWIQGLTVWAETNNLVTISKYTGKDPEFSCGNSVLYQGIDAGLLPSNRSFNIGVKINL